MKKHILQIVVVIVIGVVIIYGLLHFKTTDKKIRDIVKSPISVGGTGGEGDDVIVDNGTSTPREERQVVIDKTIPEKTIRTTLRPLQVIDNDISAVQKAITDRESRLKRLEKERQTVVECLDNQGSSDPLINCVQ